jgi:hypothetical protein
MHHLSQVPTFSPVGGSGAGRRASSAYVALVLWATLLISLPASAALAQTGLSVEDDLDAPTLVPAEEIDETLVEEVRIEDLIASWWSGPRAIHQPASGRTLSTGVAADGTFTLTEHDRSSGDVARVALGREEADDHNTPAVLTGPDLPTMVFYARHGKDRFLRMRVADSPWSISLGEERRIELPGRVTYVQAFRGPYRGSVRVLSRVSGAWWMGESLDHGVTWEHRELFRFPQGQSGYVITSQRSDGLVRFAAAGHPVNSDLRAVWAGSVELDGTIRDHRGTVVASLSTGDGLPLDVTTAMPPVYTVPEGHSLRLFDVGVRDGSIDVALADWSLDDHLASYRIVSSTSDAIDLGPAGVVIGFDLATHYHGGIAFGDREDGLELVLSRERDGTWTLEQWWSEPDGELVGRTLFESALALLRPIVAMGASGEVTLLHQAQFYGEVYTDYQADKILLIGEPTRASVTPFEPTSPPPEPSPAPQPDQDPAAVDARVVTGDWNGDGTFTPGWFADGIWHLLLDARTGATTTFRFGATGDVPVTGDWNGDGRTTVGVRREGDWLLRNGNSRGPVSYSFLFGRPSDVPVTGDWNGDGRTTVGVRREGDWLLRNGNSRGPVSYSFLFGRPSDVPVTGDWNGDGRTTVGVRRGGDWLLRNGNSRGPVSYSFLFGRPSDVPVTGDWNGDGRTTVGVERDREWLLRDANSRGPVTQRLSFAS